MSALSFIYRLVLKPTPPEGRLKDTANLYFRDKAHNLLAPFTLINFINISAVAAGGYHATENAITVGLWLSINLIIPALSFYTWFTTRKLTPPPTSRGSLVHKLEMTGLIYGALFGSNMILFGSLISDDGVLLLVGANMGMCAGVAAISNSLVGVARNFILPCLGFTILGGIIIGPTPEQVAVLILGTSLVIALLASTKDQYYSILKLLSQTMRAEQSHKQLQSIADNVPFGIKLNSKDGGEFTNPFWSSLAQLSYSKQALGQTDFAKSKTTGIYTVDMTRVSIPGVGELTLLEDREKDIHYAEDLQFQADEAIKVAALREDLVSLLTERLLQPISLIVGFASIMDSSSNIALDAQSQRYYCDTMGAAGRNVKDLVQDLTRISNVNKMYADDITIDVGVNSRDIKSIVRSATSKYEDRADVEAQSRITVSLGDEATDITSDGEIFTDVITALLSNALHFSKDAVDIRSGKVNGKGFISIRDKGVGIPEDQLEQIFQPFYKVHAKISKTYEMPDKSSGLGLYIARLLADKIGGTIKLQSEVNSGTTAYFIFPQIYLGADIMSNTENLIKSA